MRSIVCAVGASFAMAVFVMTMVSALANTRVADLTRVVPEGAVLQYMVRGVVVQQMTLQPGSYRIVVERVER